MAHFQGKVLFFSRVYTQENHRNVSLFRKRSWCTINNSPLIHWNPRTKKSLRFSGEKMSIFRDPGAICWVDLRTNLPQSVADVMRAIFRCKYDQRSSSPQILAASWSKDVFSCSSRDVFVVEPYLAYFKQIQVWVISTCFFEIVSNYQRKLHGKKTDVWLVQTFWHMGGKIEKLTTLES